MARYAVLQPNGKLMVWSTIVDAPIAIDCTPEEATEVLLEDRRAEIASHVSAVQNGTNPTGGKSWSDCLGRAGWVHGEGDESVLAMMRMTPNLAGGQNGI